MIKVFMLIHEKWFSFGLIFYLINLACMPHLDTLIGNFFPYISHILVRNSKKMQLISINTFIYDDILMFLKIV